MTLSRVKVLVESIMCCVRKVLAWSNIQNNVGMPVSKHKMDVGKVTGHEMA